MLSMKSRIQETPSFYAPSFALAELACGWYGVGHTAIRQPGDMRGTVMGKKGRFRWWTVNIRGGDL